MNVTSGNFGIVIAYIIPGFVILWGLSFFSPAIQGWLATAPASEPTVGGFLYVTLGSVGAGLVSSTIRWLVIDTIHHKTGVREPKWDFGGLAEKLSGFQLVVEWHYAYYKFYGNGVVAVAIADISYQMSHGIHGVAACFGVIALEAVLWVGSRDTLKRFYRRGEQLDRRGGRPRSRRSLAETARGS